MVGNRSEAPACQRKKEEYMDKEKNIRMRRMKRMKGKRKKEMGEGKERGEGVELL